MESFEPKAADCHVSASASAVVPYLSHVIVYTTLGPGEDVTAVPAGQYRRHGNEYALVSDAFDPRELHADDMLVVGTVTREGVRVQSGAGLARLIFKGAVLDPTSSRLTQDAISAVTRMRAMAAQGEPRRIEIGA